MVDDQSKLVGLQSYDWQGPLSRAQIYILGSQTTGESVARDLYKAGAKKIVLLNAEPDSLEKRRYQAKKKEDEFCQTINLDWTLQNLETAIENAEIVIDTLSDWQNKLALSDVCMELDKAIVHSGISGFRFQIYTMIPGRSACLRCALPKAGIDQVPLTPAKNASLNIIIELVNAWLSLETTKYLSKIGVTQGNELFKFDCLSGEFEVIRGLDANPDCPDCGRKFSKIGRIIGNTDE